MEQFNGFAINYNINNTDDIKKILKIEVEIPEHSQSFDTLDYEIIKPDELYVKSFSKGSVLFLGNDFTLNQSQLIELSEDKKVLNFSINKTINEIQFEVFENKKSIKKVVIANGAVTHNEGNALDIEYSGVKGEALFYSLFFEITGEKFSSKYQGSFLHVKHSEKINKESENSLNITSEIDNLKSSKKTKADISSTKKQKSYSVFFFVKLFILLLFASGLIFYFIPKNSQKNEITAKNLEILNVDDQYCEIYGLPRVNFSFSYSPEFAKFPPKKGQKNDQYMGLNIEKDSICSEGIAMNYLQLGDNIVNNEILQREILKSTAAIEENDYHFKLSESFVEKIQIGDKKYLVWRGKGTSMDPNDEFEGDYLIQHVFFQNKAQKNGLFLIMFANKNSSIKTFEDFTTKGYISKVLQTLKFKD